ncbi:MAG: hypothetical protein M0R49_08320 [Limnochordia bacterium]|jgi:hypothetical protein|nr:hypothetical protein [Limnochordia bacterium]
MKRKLVFLMLVALFLVGCSTYEREMLPPKVHIGGGNTVAVLFLDNFTSDYAISHEVEQQVIRTLSEYYRVISPEEAEWALVRLGLLRGQSPNRDEAIRLGQMLGVDAVVMGEVSGYFAPVTQGQAVPTKERTDSRGVKGYDWEISQNTRVMVSFTGRVMDTRGGNIIHRIRAEGESSTDSKKTIGWFADGDRPGFWSIPSPHNSDIPYVKQSAIRLAVGKFTQDLMPTYEWHKVEE